MNPRLSADTVIAHYMNRDLPASDYRVLFAAVLMQAKKDIQYAGGNSRTTPYTFEVRRWIDHRGDPAGITFRMCCEALSLDEGAAKKYLMTPYKEARPWNGRSAKSVKTTPRSARTCSKSKRRSSPSRKQSVFASFAARHPLPSSLLTTPCSTL
jgi:hypothetical protein